MSRAVKYVFEQSAIKGCWTPKFEIIEVPIKEVLLNRYLPVITGKITGMEYTGFGVTKTGEQLGIIEPNDDNSNYIIKDEAVKFYVKDGDTSFKRALLESCIDSLWNDAKLHGIVQNILARGLFKGMTIEQFLRDVSDVDIRKGLVIDYTKTINKAKFLAKVLTSEYATGHILENFFVLASKTEFEKRHFGGFLRDSPLLNNVHDLGYVLVSGNVIYRVEATSSTISFALIHKIADKKADSSKLVFDIFKDHVTGGPNYFVIRDCDILDKLLNSNPDTLNLAYGNTTVRKIPTLKIDNKHKIFNLNNCASFIVRDIKAASQNLEHLGFSRTGMSGDKLAVMRKFTEQFLVFYKTIDVDLCKLFSAHKLVAFKDVSLDYTCSYDSNCGKEVEEVCINDLVASNIVVKKTNSESHKIDNPDLISLICHFHFIRHMRGGVVYDSDHYSSFISDDDLVFSLLDGNSFITHNTRYIPIDEIV